MPVTADFVYSCDNKSVCNEPDTANVAGLQPGWAQLSIDYADGGGGMHHYSITLGPVDTAKFVATYPGINFVG